jgi:hypothetical protein
VIILLAEQLLFAATTGFGRFSRSVSERGSFSYFDRFLIGPARGVLALRGILRRSLEIFGGEGRDRHHSFTIDPPLFVIQKFFRFYHNNRFRISVDHV